MDYPESVTRIVACPTCGGDSEYGPANAARPFCSPRCKHIDLGAWASESFSVPASTDMDDPELDEPRAQ